MGNLLVMKYGGKSLANLDLIRAVALYIKERLSHQAELKIAVVVSAMNNRTDEILENMRALNPDSPERELAAALQVGETESAAYLATAITSLGVKARSYNALQLGIQTFGGHDKARIKGIDRECLDRAFSENRVIVVAGYQGVSDLSRSEIAVLGRGGSDITAVALAAELRCDVEFYKAGVAGVHTFDPRISKKARVFKHLRFAPAISLAEYGYEFLMTRSLQVAERFGVTIEFRQTPGLLDHDPWKVATIIDPGETHDIEENNDPLCAVAVKEHQTLIVFGGVPNIPGWSDKIYSLVDVPFIDSWQASFGNKATVAILINEEDTDNMLSTLSRIQSDEVTLMITRNLANVTLIHSQANSESRIFYRIGKWLHEAGVNIQAQYSSGMFIHTLVSCSDLNAAVLTLAKEFGLEETA